MSHTVALVKTKGVMATELRPALEKALALLDDPLGAIRPGSTVLIKPNITADSLPWQEGIVTNPNLVRAIIDLVRQKNPKKVLVAEAIAVGLDVKKAYNFLGYDEIAGQAGAELVDLYDHDFVETPGGEGPHKSLQISRLVLEADYVINVPLIKSHVATTISVAMKNLMGTVSSEQKRRFHYYGLVDSIIQLNSLVKPDLHICDGTVAGEGNGPVANTPADFRTLLAGRDARALDMVCAQIMGFDPADIRFLRRAAQAWGPLGLDDIKVKGETLAACLKGFRPAAAAFDPPPGVECDTGAICDECAGVLQLAMARLEGDGDLEAVKPLRVVCGEKKYEPRPGEKVLAVGRCQAHMQGSGYFVPGCPPQVFLVADELRAMQGGKRIFGPREQFMFKDEK
jgi:uncharacterized protein (DUF362 family)